MERRDFLAAFAATAATVAAKPFDGGPPPAIPASRSRCRRRLTWKHTCCALMTGWRESASLVRPRWHRASPGDRATTDALARSALQAMFLTGMLGDLPLPSQAHPGMQERMRQAMPLFDTAVDGTTSFPALAPRTTSRACRHRSDGRRCASASSSRSAPKRKKAASPHRDSPSSADMLQHVTWRLAQQPPHLMVSEYLEKVEKVAATDVESEARQRQLVAHVSEKAFWALDERSARDKRISRGAKTMGIGSLVVVGGAIVVAAGAFPGVFAMTVGVIMMLVGLVILLVGLATLSPKPGNTTSTPSSP